MSWLLKLGPPHARILSRAPLSWALTSALFACASAPAPRPAPATPVARTRETVHAPVSRAESAQPTSHSHELRPTSTAGSASTASTGSTAQVARPARTVGVRGITGSLTAFEVEQAMNSRGRELLACVEKRPRALAHVAGDIAFHIVLDGQGKVEQVAVTQSDIGYAPLEECLAVVVATAPLPVPAGAERTETQWRMSVDPLRRGAEPLPSEQLEETIAHQAEATYESCEVGKGRRFQVTGYLTGGRKLHPVTVRVPWRANARVEDQTSEQLACLAESLEKWTRWPKARGRSKVSFELRWVAAPKSQKKSQKKRVRRRA